MLFFLTLYKNFDIIHVERRLICYEKRDKEQGIRMLAGALVGISLGTIIGKGIRTLILNRIPVSGILSTTDDLYSIYDAAIVNLVPEGDIESSENQANFFSRSVKPIYRRVVSTLCQKRKCSSHSCIRE